MSRTVKIYQATQQPLRLYPWEVWGLGGRLYRNFLTFEEAYGLFLRIPLPAGQEIHLAHAGAGRVITAYSYAEYEDEDVPPEDRPRGRTRA